MITVFTRREAAVTFSMKERDAVCGRLRAAGIRYQTRTFSHNLFQRGRAGSLGINAEYTCQYRIYVHRKDFERARAALR